MWISFALLAAFFAALTAIFSKLGVREIPSHAATLARTGVVLLLAFAFAWRSNELAALREAPRPALLWLLLSGVTTGLSWLCYFRALEVGPLSSVAALDKLSLPLTVALAALLLHEPLGARGALGLLLIGIGTWLLVMK